MPAMAPPPVLEATSLTRLDLVLLRGFCLLADDADRDDQDA
jgi:hypothetical protein